MSDIEIPDWTKLGSTIRAERKRAGLSQQALAERAGLSRSWLARLEAGHRTAELESIMRLLRALDLTLVLRRPTDPDEPASPAESTAIDDAVLTTLMQALVDQHQRTTATRSRRWSTTRTDPGHNDE